MIMMRDRDREAGGTSASHPATSFRSLLGTQIRIALNLTNIYIVVF
jgi:hypothetical protein